MKFQSLLSCTAFVLLFIYHWCVYLLFIRINQTSVPSCPVLFIVEIDFCGRNCVVFVVNTALCYAALLFAWCLLGTCAVGPASGCAEMYVLVQPVWCISYIIQVQQQIQTRVLWIICLALSVVLFFKLSSFYCLTFTFNFFHCILLFSFNLHVNFHCTNTSTMYQYILDGKTGVFKCQFYYSRFKRTPYVEVCLVVCLSVSLSVCLSVCLSDLILASTRWKALLKLQF